jgi:hypothetical protein
MKKYQNVLSPQLLEEVQRERDSLYDTHVWKSSQLVWPDGIKVGITGDCSVTLASDRLTEKIKAELEHVLPKHKEFICQHYVWKENAGISWHLDDARRFGLSIYLNPIWEIDYGGLFVWASGDGLRASCPEYNTAMLNDDNEGHLVTPVTRVAKTPRHTLQIWGFKD